MITRRERRRPEETGSSLPRRPPRSALDPPMSGTCRRSSPGGITSSGEQAARCRQRRSAGVARRFRDQDHARPHHGRAARRPRPGRTGLAVMPSRRAKAEQPVAARRPASPGGGCRPGRSGYGGGRAQACGSPRQGPGTRAAPRPPGLSPHSPTCAPRWLPPCRPSAARRRLGVDAGLASAGSARGRRRAVLHRRSRSPRRCPRGRRPGDPAGCWPAPGADNIRRYAGSGPRAGTSTPTHVASTPPAPTPRTQAQATGCAPASPPPTCAAPRVRGWPPNAAGHRQRRASPRTDQDAGDRARLGDLDAVRSREVQPPLRAGGRGARRRRSRSSAVRRRTGTSTAAVDGTSRPPGPSIGGWSHNEYRAAFTWRSRPSPGERATSPSRPISARSTVPTSSTRAPCSCRGRRALQTLRGLPSALVPAHRGGHLLRAVRCSPPTPLPARGDHRRPRPAGLGGSR